MTNENIGLNEFLDTFEKNDSANGSNAFLNSLDNVTAEELSGKTVKKVKTKRRITNLMIDFMALVCLAVFGFCFYRVVVISAGYTQSDKMYEAIAEDYQNALSGKNQGLVSGILSDKSLNPMKGKTDTEEEDDKKQETESNPTYTVTTGSLQYQQILVFLENLKSQNSDTYGYIDVSGTKISFPVVQSSDNSYYLTHSFEKTYLKSGTIYVDSSNSVHIEKNRNTVLYGHNLTNGGMFHHVVDFLKEEVFMTSDIKLSTFDGIYTFKVFSIYPTTSTGSYFRTRFYSDKDFVEFCVQEEERSLFHKEGIEFTKDSVIITLSTCIHGQTEGRYALHAVLTGVEK